MKPYQRKQTFQLEVAGLNVQTIQERANYPGVNDSGLGQGGCQRQKTFDLGICY